MDTQYGEVAPFYPLKINKSSYFDKMTRYVYCLTIYGLWLRPALSRFPVGIPAIQAGTEAIPYEIGNFPADASPGPVAGVERVALRRQMSSGQPTGRWRASPMATGAALGSEWPERRIQRRFGRTIQFCGVTKPGCRNGAATWAECSGGRSVARGSWGKPVFRLTASSQLAESLARGRVPIQRDGTSTQAERRPG